MDQNIANYLANQQQQVRQMQSPTMPVLQQPMQAAMGGIGGMANLGQMAQGQFSDAHNAVYEKLRNVLMGLHSQGVPGMDKVVNSLNQTHVSQMKPPTMPKMVNQSDRGAVPSQVIDNVNQQMQNGVLGANTTQMPQQNPMQQMMQSAPTLLPFAPAESRLPALQNLANSNYNPQIWVGGEMEMTPENIAPLVAKVKAGGMSALTPQEQALIFKTPSSVLQQASTNIPHAQEVANTHAAVNPTLPQGAAGSPQSVQGDILKSLSGLPNLNLGNALYKAISDQGGKIDFNAKVGNPIEKAAIKEYGTTTDPESGAYITQNGKMIDSSGKLQGAGENARGRAIDHREIATAALPDSFKKSTLKRDAYSGSEAMNLYMDKTNNIRMNISPDEAGFDVMRMPSDAQLKTMQKASQGKPIYADITNPNTGGLDHTAQFPNFDEYLTFLKNYFSSEKGGINFGATIGRNAQKPPTIPTEDYRNTPTISQIQNELFKSLQGMGNPNFSAMMRQ